MIALVDGRVHGKVEEPFARSKFSLSWMEKSDNKNNKTQYQVQRMGCILGDEGAKRLVGRELLDWPS